VSLNVVCGLSADAENLPSVLSYLFLPSLSFPVLSDKAINALYLLAYLFGLEAKYRQGQRTFFLMANCRSTQH
jgi:hypothetical protein